MHRNCAHSMAMAQAGAPVVLLKEQYRMLPNIAASVSAFTIFT